MNIAELEAFLAVYDEGTYTKAATLLGISQPAITRRVSLLESDLDCVLFERGRHGARATPPGEAFVLYARRALGELRAGANAVKEIEAGESGRLTLAVAGTIPNTRLMRHLRAFRQRNPRVQLIIHTGTSNDVSDMVANGEADIGVRYFPSENPVLSSQLVFKERGSIVAANPTTLLDVNEATREDLAACPWILFPTGADSSGEPIANRVLEGLTGAGIRPAHITRIDGLSAQKRLVASDFGLAVMQESAVVDELAAGTIQQVSADWLQVEFPIHLVTRKHGYERALRERLIAELGDISSDFAKSRSNTPVH